MAFNYANIASDALDTWLNGLLAKLKSVINAFPGGNIVAGSVTLDKLAKQKARGTWDMSPSGDTLINASVNPVSIRTVLNSDGIAAMYKIVGWSVGVGQSAGGAAPVLSTSATLTFHDNGGAPILTIPIDSSTALSTTVPLSADLSATPVSISSGHVLSCRYTWAATAGTAYYGLKIHLDWTLSHAGT